MPAHVGKEGAEGARRVQVSPQALPPAARDPSILHPETDQFKSSLEEHDVRSDVNLTNRNPSAFGNFSQPWSPPEGNIRTDSAPSVTSEDQYIASLESSSDQPSSDEDTARLHRRMRRTKHMDLQALSPESPSQTFPTVEKSGERSMESSRRAPHENPCSTQGTTSRGSPRNQ